MTTQKLTYNPIQELFGHKTFAIEKTKRLTNVVEILECWYQRAKQRQQLARLTAEQLDDIGINKALADKEARKPFWK